MPGGGQVCAYALGDARLLDALAALRAIAQARSGAAHELLASHLGSRDALEAVPPAELLARARGW
jgi:hypothetical protein